MRAFRKACAAVWLGFFVFAEGVLLFAVGDYFPGGRHDCLEVVLVVLRGWSLILLLRFPE